MRPEPFPALAFIGTGLMGAPMAGRLLAAGFPVKLWNRTAEKYRALVEAGAIAAASPADAAAGADIVILMLADGPAVAGTLFDDGVADALAPGALVLDMSSIRPDMARDHALRLARRGIGHLDAPVSGGTRGAAKGTLAIMAGGDPASFERARPVFDYLGRPTLVGPGGAGQLAKLANQIIVAVTIGAVAEALLLAAAGGADPEKVRDALSGGFADSMILKQHGGRMLERAWEPGGPMRMQVKDLRAILATAAHLGLELPMVEKIATLFEAGVDAGLGEHDHSAVLLALEGINAPARVGDKPDRGPRP